MFSSKKDSAAAAAAAAATSIPQAKRAARSSAPSIISADLIVNGTLISTGDIQVDGRVEGDVRSAALVIGDKAFINGEVVAEDVTVRGRVQGVGYRFFTLREASKLGLSGYARNLEDGSVEVYAVGSEDTLSELARKLHMGPMGADVRGVEEAPADLQKRYGFTIEP